MGEVILVHHVDTEGPLNESLDATFLRIESTFNVNISVERTGGNLKKIFNGDIPIDGLNLEILNATFNSHLLSYNRTWDEVEDMLSRLFEFNSGSNHIDSYGQNYIYTWHIMDHYGFEENPRGRILGNHGVLDKYLSFFESKNIKEQEIQFHYHPLHPTRNASLCATSYDRSLSNFYDILTRRAFERHLFPSVYRPGFHTIRPDAAAIIERWFPFEASNQSVEDSPEKSVQSDEANCRFGDWNGALNNWEVYHPDHRDWRNVGTCKRTISRVLNVYTRFRNISEIEIRKAFLRARSLEKNVLLGVTNHDFRDMIFEQNYLQILIENVRRDFPDVTLRYCGANEGFNRVLYGDNIVSTLDYDVSLNENVLTIKVIGNMYSVQPYFAYEDTSGNMYHDNLDFPINSGYYKYTFDIHTCLLEKLNRILIVANDNFGNQTLCIYAKHEKSIVLETKKRNTWNQQFAKRYSDLGFGN